MLAATRPDLVRTLTALSVPHPAAYARAMLTTRQGRASWYMYFFQLPYVPELLLTRRRGALATGALRRMGQTQAAAERDVAAMLEPGALTAGINWYRGMPLMDPRATGGKITVPTMFVWSDEDPALLAKGAYDTARYVSAEYRFEVMPGASHWIPEERPDELAGLLLEWFAAHPTT